MDLKTNAVGTICIALVLMILLPSCSTSNLSPREESICGHWAYIHDPDTAVLQLNKNGSAVYEGISYSFSADDDFIHFHDGDQEVLSLRYRLENQNLIVYPLNEYDCDQIPNGLAAEWKCVPKNWSFEFTEEGTFIEDGLFSGTYTTNAQENVFTLHYNEDFDDISCFYSISGNHMTVEYPWVLIKSK